MVLIIFSDEYNTFISDTTSLDSIVLIVYHLIVLDDYFVKYAFFLKSCSNHTLFIAILYCDSKVEDIFHISLIKLLQDMSIMSL